MISIKSYLRSLKAKEKIPTFLAFILCKLLVFLVPLAWLHFYGELSFGNFEYSLNLGQFIMLIFSTGIPVTYGYFYSVKRDVKSLRITHFHFFLLFLLTCPLVFIPAVLSSWLYTSLLIGLLLSNQAFLATTLRLRNKNTLSVIFDSILYIILAFYIFFSQAFFDSNSVVFINLTLFTILLIINLSFHKPLKKIYFEKFKSTYTFALNAFSVSPVFFLIAISTRIQLGYFSNEIVVAEYAIYFRIFSILVLFGRLIYIFIMKKLFEDELSKLDFLFSRILFFFIGVVLISTPLLGFLAEYFNLVLDFSYRLAGIVQIQIILWILMSYFEPLVSKLKITKNVLKSTWFLVLLNWIGAYFILKIDVDLIEELLLLNVFLTAVFIYNLIGIIKKTSNVHFGKITPQIIGFSLLAFLIVASK